LGPGVLEFRNDHYDRTMGGAMYVFQPIKSFLTIDLGLFEKFNIFYTKKIRFRD